MANAGKGRTMADKLEELRNVMMTADEAFSLAEFIDMNIFHVIRTDTDWDNFQTLRNLVHVYEKCCAASGYVGLTDTEQSREGET